MHPLRGTVSLLSSLHRHLHLQLVLSSVELLPPPNRPARSSLSLTNLQAPLLFSRAVWWEGSCVGKLGIRRR
ncbi:hypothetical protein KC19_1G063200 [Ceratodon purpureus]|uniref:Uncharacterized protein n=1 Tax=Ceratodon purpureus TaxID=3225 RepID=A0A8T0J257_CERPU|nr:hypothetical protein KC19_1G063200 [Ceratodon purpureus]